MMVERTAKKANTGTWVNKTPQASAYISGNRPVKKLVADKSEKSKPFARGTIEDRMDSENAGIVFLD